MKEYKIGKDEIINLREIESILMLIGSCCADKTIGNILKELASRMWGIIDFMRNGNDG